MEVEICESGGLKRKFKTNLTNKGIFLYIDGQSILIVLHEKEN
jgi:hypothetical protein